MNKSELDHVWHSVTSALEKEFWTRGWFSPQAARMETLEAALRDVEDALGYVKNEGKSPAVRESNAHTAWKIARAALAPEQDK